MGGEKFGNGYRDSLILLGTMLQYFVIIVELFLKRKTFYIIRLAMVNIFIREYF